MKEFKGILLDIDNTLYQYSRTHDIALETTLHFMHQTLDIELQQLFRVYREAREHIHLTLKNLAACHNRLLYFQTMMELLKLKPFGLPYLLYRLYWSTFMENMTLFPGITEFFTRLKGLPICLVTDMTADIQHQKVMKLGIDSYVQYMVTSEEVGHEKPHPKIFQCALKKLNLKANEVCMIGDSYEKDILGAAELGISSFWLRPDTDSNLPSHMPCNIFTHFEQLYQTKCET